ncbi:MAG TPA: ABC transporter permease [Actinomycetota bacterium]|jgi:peptide/nickel transport system permease protein|nr:ABC transporter permease [Actinomycetota bacterium]
MPGGPHEGGDVAGPAVQARTPRQIFWARFKQDKLALFGAGLVIFMIVIALLAPLAEAFTGHQYDEQFRGVPAEGGMLNDFGTPIGPQLDRKFYFGADSLARDLFVRVLYGARTSLQIAIIATGFEIAIGVFMGMLAGYLRGWVDTVVSRLIDLILSIPFLLLAIALSVSYGGSKGLVVTVIVFFGWPYIARIVRGQVLSLRESQFVEAALSLGAPTRWVMARELLPNLIAPVIVYGTLIIPTNILIESALSFLGVGIQEPTASWGKMLSDATGYIIYGAAWWYMVFPGLFLFLTVLGFNLLGDGLRDALDPKTRG